MHKKIKDFFPPFTVWSIIFCAIGLRLFKLTALFHFTYDEEVFAFVGKRMFVNGHIPLIGGVTPMHVHVAPYFYWLSGFFLWLSHLNPVGWGIAAAVVSGFTMLFLYKTGEAWFGKQVAIISLLLYSSSFYQNIFDRHYWGLVFDGLVSILTLFSLYKIKLGYERYFYLLVVVIAFGVNADLSMLTLLLTSIISWWYLRLQVSRKTLILGILLFLISFSPLIIFDVRHNLANSRGILQYIAEVKSGRAHNITSILDTFLFMPRSLFRLIYVFGDTDLAKQYSYCSQHLTARLNAVPKAAAFMVVGSFIYFLWKIKKIREDLKRTGSILITILFIVSVIGVLIYGFFFHGDLFDHYLAPLFPIFFLVIGFTLNSLFKKKQTLLWIVVAFIICLNAHELFLVKHSFGFGDKIAAVNWAIEKTGVKDFSLDVISSCFRYNGYRYLFYVYGKEPTKSYVDQNFTYLYDRPPAQTHPPYLVVITNPDFVETPTYYAEYARYKSRILTSQIFGRTEVLLIDNSKLEFVNKF